MGKFPGVNLEIGKKGSNLSFTQLFLFFGVGGETDRGFIYLYCCIYLFLKFLLLKLSGYPKENHLVFLVCPNMIWQTVEVSYIWVSRVSVTFPL